jgi:hypothetical protein
MLQEPKKVADLITEAANDAAKQPNQLTKTKK